MTSVLLLLEAGRSRLRLPLYSRDMVSLEPLHQSVFSTYLVWKICFHKVREEAVFSGNRAGIFDPASK
jgi:hypothetical protein